MKNIKIIVAISLILIIGLFFLVRCCEYEEDPLSKIEVGEMHDYRFDDSEIPELATSYDYMKFVSDNISYKDETKDYWQTPEETWLFKTGDCEDFDILFMYLIETRLDIRTKLVLIEHPEKGQHTLIKIDNLYYELIHGFSNTSLLPGWYEIWTASYPEIIWMTYYYHDNVGKYY